MFANIKKIIYKLGSPLLFYTDKSGNSVFKNYHLFSEDGCLYKTKYSMPEAGKVLEYRFDLSKKALYVKILLFILLYILFLSVKLSVFSFLFFIISLVVLFHIVRSVCNRYYEQKLLNTFGSYKLVDFNPNISKDKKKGYVKEYNSKFIAVLIALLIFYTPAFLMYGFVKFNIKSPKPRYKAIVKVVEMYSKVYPKNTEIYDISAYARYVSQDYEGALKDYKTVFKISGKSFEKKDLTRFANLLFLSKRVSGAQEAVDEFNEYATKKRTSIFEQSQLLWIKSMFSVINDITAAIGQDYDDLLMSIPEDDFKNRFYISCDKAYMFYLMEEYYSAVQMYDKLIAEALQNGGIKKEDISSLYAERGFARAKLDDVLGAKEDFKQSGFSQEELPQHEPREVGQGFVIEKF